MAHRAILIGKVRLVVRHELGLILRTEDCFLTELLMQHLNLFSFGFFTLAEEALLNRLMRVSARLLLLLADTCRRVDGRRSKLPRLRLVLLLVLVLLLEVAVHLIVVAGDGPLVVTW